MALRTSLSEKVLLLLTRSLSSPAVSACSSSGRAGTEHRLRDLKGARSSCANQR